MMTARRIALTLLLATGLMGPVPGAAQEVRIQDLTVGSHDVPMRLMGYGLVVGLDGTGDRVIGGFSSGHTVRSVANLLRRFDVEVPEQILRTRNVAAVLVTAEVSPYLRPGGRFEIHVSSVGDAQSLRGGVLWMTPLVPDLGAIPVATGQGPLLISEGADGPRGDYYVVETTARIPDGGVLEQPLPTPDFAQSSVLHLRSPNLLNATRIAEAINTALGDGSAEVVDPGAVTLNLTGDAAANKALTLAQIGELNVAPERVARVIIDGRSGTVVAGGNLQVGEAVVSHGSMTLSVGGTPADQAAGMPSPGDVRMAAGVSVQDVAAALHAVAAPPTAIGAVFSALRDVGAIQARVVVR
jgi:flagellar P-ring protein precursor FlgI